MERAQNPVRRRDLGHSHEEEAERAVKAYSDLILRLSYTYLKSTHEAQDICQEVLLKLLCGAGPFESAEHEKAWVVRTTANACKDVLRSARRRRTAPLDAAADALEAPSGPEAPESEVLERVMALPQKYREALYLHYFEGYPIKDVARLTGRSEAAVAAHLSRGRAKLRAQMKGAYCGQGI